MTVSETRQPPEDQAMFEEQKQQAYIDKKKAQYEELSAEIDKLRAKVKQASADVRSETYDKLEQLIQARDDAGAQLNKMRDVSKETWSDLLKQTDSIFQEFSERYHDFVRSHT